MHLPSKEQELKNVLRNADNLKINHAIIIFLLPGHDFKCWFQSCFK